MTLSGGSEVESAPADRKRLSAGLTTTVDRTLALPARRRGFLSAEVNRWGWEGAAGLRLWSAGWSDGALAAWAGAPWDDPLDPTYGVRAEMRF